MSPTAKKAPSRPAPKPAAAKLAKAPAKAPAKVAAKKSAKSPVKKATNPLTIARREEPRKLTDPRVIRALAHPVRIALLEALVREGPLTATERG